MLGLWTSTLSSQGAALQASLSVDPQATGPAISPYLYGQFIEHLGRCIHDGVWAEKLQDRKFYLALDKSPWQPVREPGAQFEVFLDTAGAYTGEHCLALWRHDQGSGPCAVRQSGIGLVKGKEYVGYVIAAAVSGQPVLEVALESGSPALPHPVVPLRGLSREYRRLPFRFRADQTTDSASFSLRVRGPGLVWVGCASLMPADNVHGMRADVLPLIKQLNPPITRWPGGNFVSGYDWKDGIGQRDRRPPRWERAWGRVEDNDFGLDEFMTFCHEVGTEPYIAVNTGLGSVQDAADEVDYATGSPRTRWGAERARHGHRAPYQVTWWGIGNEMFGDWQLGNVPVERYALRHNSFVAAMKERNPHIKVIAVGAPGHWNDAMLPLIARHTDLLSGHHYSERKFKLPFTPEDAQSYETNFETYSASVLEGIRHIAEDYRHRLGPADPELNRVRLAIDEWGIVRDWNPAPDPPGLGPLEHYYPLGDGLAAARGLHELLRSADVVQMANWAQTVNVIGAIKATHNAADLSSVGEVLALYRARVGGTLVPVHLSPSVPVDAVAAVEKKHGRLALGLVNFSPNQEVSLKLDCGLAQAPGHLRAWRIDGPSLEAVNRPGEPEAVTTRELAPLSWEQPLVLPAHSVTVLSGD